MRDCLRRRFCIVLAAIVALGLGSVSAAGADPADGAVRVKLVADLQALPPAPPPVLDGPACPDVMVIGARGAGEAPSDWTNDSAYTSDPNHGAGAAVYSLYQDIGSADSGLTYSLYPVVYPAEPVFKGNPPVIYPNPVLAGDAQFGAKTIAMDIETTDIACGHTVHYILAGYSLGAWAVHDALHQLSAAQLGEIAGVALFGDPLFLPLSPIVREYKLADIYPGLGVLLDPSDVSIPTAVTSRTGSWCLPADPVCQALGNPAWHAEAVACAIDAANHNAALPCAHLDYPGAETAAGAAFLKPSLPSASLWPHLTSTAPPSGTVGEPYTWTAAAAPAATYTWTSVGALPPGLTFSAAGVLSGTPTQAGDFTFSITATGAYGRSVTGSVTVTIAGTATSIWATVSTGSNTTCATRTDGTLWCWGSTTTELTATPFQVGSATSWATVSVGNGPACATRTDGTLWCWGDNTYGELGTGDTTSEVAPTQVGSATSWATVSVSSGDTGPFTCATRTDGTLWCWGNNGSGQLGTGDTTNRLTPTQVGSATSWATVSTDQDDTCATRTDGTLWCWGDNTYGQLGTGDTASELTPTQVGAATSWATVSVGNAFACAVSTGGTVWCWGYNGSGQLGTGDTTNRLTPTQVGSAISWAAVSARGGDNTCATRTDGTLWCWGDNGDGQLGIGNTTSELTPTEAGSATSWTTISGGFLYYECATRTDGTLWCWGFNGSGQLGTDNNTTELNPTEVS